MPERRFVQVVPDALDDLVHASELDFDAAAILRALRDLADWRTGIVRASISDLAAHLRTSRKRVATAMVKLETAELVESRFVRGHAGEILIRCYFDLVRVGESERTGRTRFARVGESERASMTPEIAKEQVARDALASERASVRVGESEPCSVRRERPGKTPPRQEDVEDDRHGDSVDGRVRRILQQYEDVVVATSTIRSSESGFRMKVRAEKGPVIRKLVGARPDARDDEILHEVDPVRFPKRRARASDCRGCGGTGWKDVDDRGQAIRCGSCTPLVEAVAG